MAERWLPVERYDGRYEVSDLGRVRSLFASYRRARAEPLILKPRRIGDYIGFQLSKNGITRNEYAHRLVLTAFRGPAPPDKPETRHMNGRKSDNRLGNLCWGTKFENENDKVSHGTRALGERHGSAKLTEKIVRECRARHVRGARYKDLADECGVHWLVMAKAVRGETWKHIK